jgi:S1-C subfamily serine protease
MSPSTLRRVIVLTLFMACSVPVVARGTNAAAGRALVQRYAGAIIGVELVVTLKLKMGDREAPAQERRVEVNGTVISPSGLTVTSLAVVDPQQAYEAMRAQNSRVELVGADFKEVKLRLADGTEIPARFVLKDADLDLAFMAPESAVESAQRQFEHVKLEEAAEGVVLGNYFSVSRAAKALQRTPLVRATEVSGIIERPRRLFLMTEASVGTPVFDLEGAVLGVTLQNFASGRPTGLVVLPSADVAEMAQQAAAAMGSP